MTVRIALALLLASAGALAGCGGDESTTTDPSSTDPLVVYERGGGIAAMPVKLTVRDDGSSTVISGVEGDSESFELEDGALDRLREVLGEAAFADVPGPGDPAACADCYVYTVTYDGATISYAEATEVPDSVRQAIAELGAITEQHQPSTAGDIVAE